MYYLYSSVLVVKENESYKYTDTRLYLLRPTLKTRGRERGIPSMWFVCSISLCTFPHKLLTDWGTCLHYCYCFKWSRFIHQTLYVWVQKTRALYI